MNMRWTVRLSILALVLGTVATTASAEASQLALAWVDTSNDEEGFFVERRVGDGPIERIATLGPNSAAFIDVEVAPGVEYCYRVRAFNVAGVSGDSNEVCGGSSVPGPVPGGIPLSVSLTKDTFSTAETLVATVQARAGVVPTPVDAYIVVQKPDGSMTSLQTDGRLVPGLVPIARGLLLPTTTLNFSFALAGVPPGNYLWLAGVTSPGTLTTVTPVASTPFRIVR